MDGVSLVPLLQNPKGISRASLTLVNMWGNNEIQEMTVVTRDWKYIYWYYAGKGFSPAEELFHLANDRLEMKNLTSLPDYKTKLREMRKLYDNQLRHLKEHAVSYHNYSKYGVLFDRTISWDRKWPLLGRKK
jgi:hypothetical protein